MEKCHSLIIVKQGVDQSDIKARFKYPTTFPRGALFLDHQKEYNGCIADYELQVKRELRLDTLM